MRLALIGATALLILIGHAVAQQRQLQQPRNQPNQQQAAPDNRGTDQVPFVIKELPRQRTDDEKTEAQEKSELDRKLAGYTADLATYTKWLFAATLLLAGLTGGLAIAAFLQMRDARKSIDANVRLANAAETTIRHVERPYVFLGDMKAEYIVATRLFNVLAGEEARGAKNAIEFRHTIKNHGRTPAVVYEIHYAVAFIKFVTAGQVDYPPDAPEYNEHTHRRQIIDVIGANNTTKEQSWTFLSDDITGPFRNIPVIFGLIRYRDTSGRRYESGFGFTWSGDSFQPYNDAYNYDCELPPNAEPPPIPEPPYAA
jgi:hypothetical protein